MDKLNQTIKALRAWGSGQEKPSVSYGLCRNLADLGILSDAALDNLLREAFRSWPKYSGSSRYPIPDPKVPFDKAAAIGAYYSHPNLWDDSPYGNLRRELCLHIADWLEANKSKVLPFFEEKFHD